MVVIRRNKRTGQLETAGSGKTAGGAAVKITKVAKIDTSIAKEGETVDYGMLSPEQKSEFDRAQGAYYAQRDLGEKNKLMLQAQDTLLGLDPQNRDGVQITPSAEMGGITGAGGNVAQGQIEQTGTAAQLLNPMAAPTTLGELHQQIAIRENEENSRRLAAFMLDPLAFASESAQEILNKTPDGTARFTLNTAMLYLIESTRINLKKIAKGVYKYPARITASGTELTNKVNKLNKIRTGNVEAMNIMLESIRLGTPVTQQNLNDFEALNQQINEAELLMREISKDPLAFSRDDEIFAALIDFENYNRRIGNIRTELEIAQNNQIMAQARRNLGFAA